MQGWFRLWHARQQTVASEFGNDLVEYTLLLAFLVLGATAVLIGASQSMGSVWNSAGSHLKKGHGYAYGKGHGSGNPLDQ